MSTNKNKTAPKKAAASKKPKGIAPMSAERFAHLNKEREAQGLPPLPQNTNLKVVKHKEDAQPPAVVIPPSERPVNEIIAEKCVMHGGGVIEFKDKLTESEGVSLLSFYCDAQESGGIAIGQICNHLDKNYGETYDAIITATGRSKKTLMNYASVMRNVSTSLIEDSREQADKAGTPALAYSHFAAVAHLPAAEQKSYIKKAVKEKLSVSALTKEVQIAHPPTKKGPPKESAKKKKAREAAEKAAAAKGKGNPTGEADITVIEPKLTAAQEAQNEKAGDMMDAVVSYLKSDTFNTLPSSKQGEWLRMLKVAAEKYEVLLEKAGK